MSSESPDVVIGVVGPAHGLRGDVYVRPLSDDETRFAPGAAVRVGADAHTVTSSRTQKGRLLVRFSGVDDRSTAEGLRGREVRADAVVDAPPGETYTGHELLGLSVVTEDGLWLGDVTAIIDVADPAPYELLEVDADGVTWLLPDDDALVEVGETDDGTDVLVLIDPPDGLVPRELLEDGEA